jgi:XTP/dITP diphosphohydrolase
MSKQEAPEREIVIGSRNKGKIKEIQAVLAGLPVRLRSLSEFLGTPEVEETGATFRGNAEIKALALASHLERWVLADDSGLEVDALKGEPGVRSARYAGRHGDDAANNRKLLEALQDVPEAQRTARFRCVVALARPGGLILTVEGSCEGRIGFHPRGLGGFGYDPLFLYPPENQTFGELDPEVKNRISHRGEALRNLRQALAPMLKPPS